MNDDVAGLGVGFTIDTGSSFDELTRLQTTMNSTEGKIVANAASIERATGNMLKLPGAVASITATGSAATKELEAVRRATNAAEKAGEAMVRQLQRQAEVYGKTAAEIRNMRAEQRAVAADSQGLTELAGRIRVLNTEMGRLESGSRRVTASSGATRAGMQQLSFQIGDVSQQFALGVSPMTIFAQQGGQVVQALGLMKGSATGLIGFLAGPWGAVLTGAIILLGSYFGATNDATKATEELRAAEKRLADSKQTLLDARYELDKALGRNTISYADVKRAALDTALVELASAAAANQAAQLRLRTAQGEQRSLDYIRNNGVGGQKLAVPLLSLFGFGDVSGAAAKAKDDAAALNKVAADVLIASNALRKAYKGDSAGGSSASSGSSDRASIARAPGLDEEARALEAATKASASYAAALSKEAGNIGKTSVQIKEMEIAANAALAPTEELRRAIVQAGLQWELATSVAANADFQKNIIQPLQDELNLLGLVGAARDSATLALEKEAFTAKYGADAWEEYYRIKSELIGKDASLEEEQRRIEKINGALAQNVELLDIMASNAQNAAGVMAEAFGRVGGALGNLAAIYADFNANRARGEAEHIKRLQQAKTEEQKTFEQARYGLATSTAQVGLYGDLATAAKGFFNEKSKGYKIAEGAEKAFRAIEFALSVRAMVQDAAETASALAKSGVRIAKYAIEAVARAIASLPFPANLVAGAATVAALAAIGVSIAGSFGSSGKNDIEKANSGTGTVLGDSKAQSESIKNAISALKDVDVLMLNTSRQMAASLRTIEDNIAGFASLLVRQGGDINASGGVSEGFKANGIGKVLGNIPLIGGFLKGLFGSKTTVVGSGLFGGPQALGSVLSGGFDASYYSDIQKKKKFLGLTTGTKYSTQFTGADANLENQFTLILRSFNSAILAAAGPLGASTSEIEQRLNGFIINIGKIDLKGLTGEQIEEKLNAVFGAAADDMARTAFPLIEQYQRVGEGAFETLTRVVSTIEAVGASFDILGQNALNLDIAAKLGLADQFDSISALTGAVDAYFQTYYTKEEQSAARMTQLTGVFASLDLALPSTLAAFRQIVEGQDLTSAAGRETYAVLLQLAPAFADLQAAMDGAKSAADIATERADLQRQLLELQGDTAALRALQLAKLDASNRALQIQIYAIQDAQEAAKAADELRKAWMSVGDSLMDEVKRIRGLTGADGAGGFAFLQGQFNAATASARGGDQDAARQLPQLSQALLTAAAEAATSRQELDRVRAQTAASLEATFGVIAALAGGSAPGSTNAVLDALAGNQTGSTTGSDAASDSLALRFEELRAELAQLRAENTAALVAISANTGSMKRTLDNVTSQSGGDAVATVAAAA